VSVWLLDKRQLHDPSRPVDIRPIIALLEAECKQTSRLRHPGIVSVIEPMEETRTHLMWVTEEVSGSLMSWVSGCSKVWRTASNCCIECIDSYIVA
jgi:SCY1-like protein 2